MNEVVKTGVFLVANTASSRPNLSELPGTVAAAESAAAGSVVDALVYVYMCLCVLFVSASLQVPRIVESLGTLCFFWCSFRWGAILLEVGELDNLCWVKRILHVLRFAVFLLSERRT